MTEHVWLPHPEYVWVPAIIVGKGDTESKYKTVYGDVVELENSKAQNLERVTDVSLSTQGNMSNLVNLDEFGEGAVVHQLRERYRKDAIYTNIGTILVSVNPFKLLNIYSAANVEKYKQDHVNSEPHVFQIAAEAYKRLLDDYMNQAVIISGESGAGKTEATKSVLQFLSEVAGSSSGVEQQILQSNPVLEAFGNAKTQRNNNSSRFGKWMEVKFEAGGRIVAAKIVNYLLEKSRVVLQGPMERNYHVFYQVCAGLPASKKTQHQILPDAKSYNYLSSSGVIEIDGVNDEYEFGQMVNALKLLNFEEKEIDSIWSVVATVLNLGNLHFIADKDAKKGADGSKIGNEEQLHVVAKNLKLDPLTLQTALCFRSVTVRGSVSMIPLTPDGATESRDALAKSLYGKLFDWLIKRINKTLFKEASAKLTIGILDIFGFEIFQHNAFEQFCINYANEKLQQHFNNYIFKQEQDEYRKEGIDVSHIEFVDNIECLNLIEKKPSGLISMFDEEVTVPRGSDKSLIEKMHKLFSEQLKHPFYDRIRKQPEIFIVKHYAGDVSYEIEGFLNKNKDQLHDSLSMLVVKSGVELVVEIFKEVPDDDEEEKPAAGGRKGAAKGQQKAKKVKTLGSQFQTQLQTLYDTLVAAAPHYIRCIKPNSEKKGGIFTTEMALRQMKYAGLFEAIRIRKSGFPFRTEFAAFVKKHRVCLNGDQLKELNGIKEPRSQAEFVLKCFAQHLDKKDLALGQTKIFMRNSQRVILTRLREIALTKSIIVLQCYGRKIIAKHKVKAMKVLQAKCKALIGERDAEKLKAVLVEADDAHIRLFVLKRVQELVGYLDNEKHIVSLFVSSVQGGDLAELQVIDASLEQGRELDAKWPSEPHTEVYKEARSKAEALKARLIRMQKARDALQEAVIKEDIKELEAALAECQSVGIPEAETAKAAQLLARLKYEEKVMNELAAAVEKGDVIEMEAKLKLTEDIALDDKRMQQVAKAKEAMRVKYGELVQKAVDARDADKLEKELIPKIASLGEFIRDMVQKANDCLTDVYVAFVNDAIKANNIKELEEKLLPKTVSLGEYFYGVTQAANDGITKIIVDNIKKAVEGQEAGKIEADYLPKLGSLAAHFEKLPAEGALKDLYSAFAAQYHTVIQTANAGLKQLYLAFVAQAVDKQDAEKLEKEYIPKYTGLGEQFVGVATAAVDGLKSIYFGYVATATEGLDADRLEKVLIPKLETLGSQYAAVTTKAKESLEQVYIVLSEKCVDTKDAQKLEKQLIPKIKTLKLETVIPKATQALDKIYVLLAADAQEAHDAKKLEGELIPHIKELGLEHALKQAHSSLARVYAILVHDAEIAKDDAKISQVLLPKIVQLGYDDVAKETEATLGKLLENFIHDAVEAKDDKKLETDLGPKIKKLDQAKFGYLTAKVSSAMVKLYEGYIHDSESTKDINKLENVLIPKIKELNLEVLTQANFALEKLYGSQIDDAIGSLNEDKISKDLLPKVTSLQFPSLIARCKEFLEEQDRRRKEEAKRHAELAQMEEQKRKAAEEEDRKRREEEERKRIEELKRKEAERKAEEERKAAELKAAEAARIAREQEEDRKRDAQRLAEQQAAEKKRKEEEEQQKKHEEKEKKEREEEEKKRKEKEAEEAALAAAAAAAAKAAAVAAAEEAKAAVAASIPPPPPPPVAGRAYAPPTFKVKSAANVNLPGPPAGLPPGVKIPGPPPGLPPGATGATGATAGAPELPGPPPGPPPSPMDDVAAAQELDKLLQQAINEKKLDRLTELLAQAKMNTKTVRYARNLRMKLQELEKVSQDIKKAIEDVDIANLKKLLNQGYQLGLDDAELIREGRRLCYGLTAQEQLVLRVKKAVIDKDLQLLKDLLEEATSEFLDNEEIENARTFLALNTGAADWNSKMRASRANTAKDTNTGQRDSYKRFIQLKAQCPLSKCHLLRREENYAKGNFFSSKKIKSKRLQWQKEDIPRSLVKLSTAYCGGDRALSKHVKEISKQLFKNIRGYMNDSYHPYPVTLAYEVVNVGVNEPLLRDEIFCQLIKQTTFNPREESLLLGLKLFYLCISTFAPSKELTTFVFSHLALFAHPTLPTGGVGFNTKEDLATNCWIAHELLLKTVPPGAAGDPPSMQDIEQMTQGKLAPMVGLIEELGAPSALQVEDVPAFPGPPPGLPPPGLPGPPPGAPPPGALRG